MAGHSLETHLSNAEVYKIADTLLKQHGKDAVIVATMRATDLLNSGDMDGYRTWKRLIMLVDGVLDEESSIISSLH